MSLSVWILFVSVALTAVLSPGPAVLHAITNSMAFGWRRVAFSSLGNVLGLLVLSGLAMGGLGLLLKGSLLVFSALKALGAGYLILLGIRQWRSRGRALRRAMRPAIRSRSAKPRRPWRTSPARWP